MYKRQLAVESGRVTIARSSLRSGCSYDRLPALARSVPHAAEAPAEQIELPRLHIAHHLELVAGRRFECLLDVAACRDLAFLTPTLSYVGGRLAAVDTAANRRLHALARGAACMTAGNEASGAGGYIAVPRLSGAAPYVVLVAPLRRDRVALRPTDPAALVFITDPLRLPTIASDALRDLFDLTPAEARIVAGIAAGDTLERLADRARIGRNTVRTLLVRAMPKLGVNSQSGIVKLLSPLPRSPR